MAMNHRRIFLLAIYATTLIPLISIPILSSIQNPAAVNSLIAFQFIAGNCHVGLTPYFFTDPQLHPFLKQHKNIYFVLPIAVIITTAVAFFYAPPAIAATLLLLYFVWQTWHYQRQNFGVLSFLAVLTRSGSVSQHERQLLNLGVIAGIFGLFKKQGLHTNTPIERYVDLFYNAGALLIVGLLVYLIYTLIVQPKIISSPIRLSFLLISTFFYLPTFLFDNAIAAISSYALAHGCQYFVFMSFTAAKRENAKIQLLTLFSLGLLLGSLTFYLTSIKGALGVLLGITMCHFVIDAHIWKMSQPFQRQYLKNAFDFIFVDSNKS